MSVIEIVLRTLIIYFVLFILTKAMGKREVGQMTTFDYIVGITIGSLAANSALDLSQSFYEQLPPLVIFALLQVLTSYFSMKHRGFRRAAEGTKTLLIDNGVILERNLARERISIDELTARLRQKNVFRINEVDTAILENDGQMSVLVKPEFQPLTPSDLKIIVENKGIGHLVIEEGRIKEEALIRLNLTKAWLMEQLHEKGVDDPKDVMYAQVDLAGNVYIDRYEHYEQAK